MIVVTMTVMTLIPRGVARMPPGVVARARMAVLVMPVAATVTGGRCRAVVVVRVIVRVIVIARVRVAGFVRGGAAGRAPRGARRLAGLCLVRVRHGAPWDGRVYRARRAAGPASTVSIRQRAGNHGRHITLTGLAQWIQLVSLLS